MVRRKALLVRGEGLAEQVAGFRGFAQAAEHRGEVVLVYRDFRMAGWIGLLVRGEGLAEQVASFREVAQIT
jgi:hypothetical protein